VEVSRVEANLDGLCKIFEKLFVCYQDLALFFGFIDLGRDEILYLL
jgi:hypothetical protein